MPRKQRPPPVLGGLYVLAFAHADATVKFTQRRTLNVGGEWLGRVPCLAICQEFDGSDFLVQYCDSSWNPLGVSAGHESVAAAKESTERSYDGLAKKWTKQTTPKRVAQAKYRSELKAESCSFCKRTMLEVTAMVGRKVRICNHCIEEFYKAIHN